MKHYWLWLVLIVSLWIFAVPFAAQAADVEYFTTEDNFEDAVRNCRLISQVYQDEFEKFASGAYSPEGIRFQRFEYDLHYDSTMHCSYVISTVPSDPYLAYEDELTDAAYKYMTAYELRLSAIRNGNNAELSTLANKIEKQAEKIYLSVIGNK